MTKTLLAFIAISFCIFMLQPVSAYAFWDNEDDFIIEKEKRIEQKQKDKGSTPWLDKEEKSKTLRDDVDLENIPSIPPVIEYGEIGFYFAEHDGFNASAWKNYNKETLINDITLIQKIGYLTPAQQSFLKRLLLSYTKPPKGFSAIEFLTYRLETLLSFGFNQDALNLLTAYQKQLLRPEETLFTISVKTFVANNLFEAACLEILSRKPKTETEKQWRTHCNDFSHSDLHLENHVSLPPLAESYRITLNKNEPIENRLTHFETGFQHHLFHGDQLSELLNEQKDFVRIARTPYFKNFYNTDKAAQRLYIVKQITQSFSNPALPSNIHFYDYLKKIVPNPHFEEYAQALYIYFSWLLDFDRAEDWKNLIKNTSEEKDTLDFKEKRKKICNFIHFFLAKNKSGVLKHNAEPNDDMANKKVVRQAVMQSLEESCSSTGTPTAEPSFREAKEEMPDLASLIKRFKDSVGSKDKAQTGLLSFILWDANAQKTQNEADLQKNIKFILQNVSKSDLNNYVFAFSRDILYKD